jgi:TATA-binding protein-associated factor
MYIILHCKIGYLTLLEIMPYLHSKSFESRSAASVALSQIFSLVPVWQPTNVLPNPCGEPVITSSSFPKFSVRELVSSGKLLLASSGKEFSKPSGILSSSAEVKRARKEAMGRLGLEFLDNVADEIDLERELAADMEIDGDVEMEDTCPKSDATPSHPTQTRSASLDTRARMDLSDSATLDASSPVAADLEQVDMGTLSARERNRLKRKRKLGNSAFVAAPPPQAVGAKYSAAPAGQSHK